MGVESNLSPNSLESCDSPEVQVQSNGSPIRSLDEWRELVEFQMKVAERWLKRGLSSADEFAQFFFFFAGFNALYFLWGTIDDVRTDRGKRAGEEKQIHNLLGKFHAVDAGQILSDLSDTVTFFRERSPIQRMGLRDVQQQSKGGVDEGTKWRDQLGDKDERRRLLALGSILYLVRSNLVHGSKTDLGDDHVVIQEAVPAVRLLLERSLRIPKPAAT
jgi:hypothetical protein